MRKRPSLALAFILLLLPCTIRADSTAIQTSLENQYKDKVMVLRGFPAGNSLRYEASGNPLEHSPAGLWTLDAFVRLRNMRFDGRTLTIDGERMPVVSQGKGFYFLTQNSKKPKKALAVEIRAKLGPDVSLEQISDLMGKIFLTDRDSLLSFVPSYWQTCMSAGLNEVNDPEYSACRFSAQMLSIAGVNSHAVPHPIDQAKQSNPSQPEYARVFRVGNGVSPPLPTSQPEPQFTQVSLDLNLQGMVTLTLIVNDNGAPRNIEILRPLGAGLDEEAVRAVNAWKFKPAQRNGQPVAVKIAVEIAFHH